MDDWELAFDEGATPHGDPQGVLTGIAGSGVTDLFVLAHGWNTDRGGAQNLYDALIPLLRQATAAAPGGTFGAPGFLRVFWPSIWFPETPAVVPGASGSQQAGGGPVMQPDAGTAALSGAEIAAAVSAGFTGDDRDRVLEIGRLIDEGLAAIRDGASEDDQMARVTRLRDLIAELALAAPRLAPEDAGELTLLTSEDPKNHYRRLAEEFGTAPPGSSTQGLGDLFETAFNGAKDAVRVLSYTTMKARAGVVGQDGLGPQLAELHRIAPGVRVHLIGHSFGARLVSFALSAIGSADGSPVASLFLVQGAFSHFAFSQAADNPWGRSGPLNNVRDRVGGVAAATFSVHDRAVGLWYPSMSFLTRDDVAADDRADRWGAMGSDGFQAVLPVESRVLANDGSLDGPMPAGGYLRVDCAQVIADVDQSAFAGAHSDIRHLAVAQLAVAVAGVREIAVPTA